MAANKGRLAIGIGLTLMTFSCSDSTTAPTVEAASPANRVILASPVTVPVVTRDEPLETAQTASQTIGPLGGQITMPSVGLTVTVPPLALAEPTLITVTAVAGRQLAYEFAPHGIQFAVPLTVTQRLAGTSAANGATLRKKLYAGYFTSLADLNPVSASALVSEILGTSINLFTGSVSFPVWHFSGYLIAGGDGGTLDDEASAR
jgi:hypothetical protein